MCCESAGRAVIYDAVNSDGPGALRRRSSRTAIVGLVLIGGPRRLVAAGDGTRPVWARRRRRWSGSGHCCVAKRSDVPVYLDGVGTIRALNTVTVRPAGRRQAVERQLYRRPAGRARLCAGKDRSHDISSAYDQAVAKKALDEATLANGRVDFERYTRLAASNSIAKQQLDTQKHWSHNRKPR